MTDFNEIKLFSTEIDVAGLLEQSIWTVRLWRRDGRGPKWVKQGVSVRYRRDDLIAYVKSLGMPSVKEGV